ncbi:MAG TPA: hypothetical protein VM677_08445 [Actinokineospora sp.]|nr:hypothetical protein [Actinokineospora sp.]
MRITMKTLSVTPTRVLVAGQTAEVDDDEAAVLVDRGYADLADPAPTPEPDDEGQADDESDDEGQVDDEQSAPLDPDTDPGAAVPDSEADEGQGAEQSDARSAEDPVAAEPVKPARRRRS